MTSNNKNYEIEIKRLKKDILKLSEKLQYKDNEILNLKKELNRLKKAKSSAGRKFKFTEEEIETIRMTKLQLRDGKYPSQRTLAEEFDCSVGLINKILKNKI